MRARLLGAALVAAVALAAPRAGAQMIPGGPEGGPEAEVTRGTLGEGFTLRSGDGALKLNIRSHGQLQGFAETHAPDPETGERERPSVGVIVRRMRLIFQGHVYDKDIRYFVQLSFANRDMEPDLLVPVRDAQLLWTGLRDLNLRVGQMKVPFNRERVIGSSALGMVDRSISNAELNLDRDVGVMLQSRDLFGLGGLLRYALGVYGGDGRNRTIPGTGLLYAARLEVAPFGNFEDYTEADFTRAPKPRLALGFAAAHSESTARLRGTHTDTLENGVLDYRHAAADLIFKFGGLSLQAEVLLRKAAQTALTRVEDDGAVSVERPRNAWGTMVQAGFMVSKHVEPSLRYSEVRPLDRTNPEVVRDREVGGGLSYYFHEHALKVQLDYFRLLTDAGPDDDSVLGRDRVRVQSQIYF